MNLWKINFSQVIKILNDENYWINRAKNMLLGLDMKYVKLNLDGDIRSKIANYHLLAKSYDRVKYYIRIVIFSKGSYGYDFPLKYITNFELLIPPDSKDHRGHMIVDHNRDIVFDKYISRFLSKAIIYIIKEYDKITDSFCYSLEIKTKGDIFHLDRYWYMHIIISEKDVYNLLFHVFTNNYKID